MPPPPLLPTHFADRDALVNALVNRHADDNALVDSVARDAQWHRHGVDDAHFHQVAHWHKNNFALPHGVAQGKGDVNGRSAFFSLQRSWWIWDGSGRLP